MAKECSFDIVCETNLQEVDNAYQQARKELAQRYDLKGSGASLDFDKAAKAFTVSAPSEFVARQVIDILSSKLAKRGVDLASVSWGDASAASGGTVRMSAIVLSGIDADTARKIAKCIRDMKVKAKPTIEGDKVRVASASRDTLQQVIASLKEQDFGLPLSYTNYR